MLEFLKFRMRMVIGLLMHLMKKVGHVALLSIAVLFVIKSLFISYLIILNN